MKQGLREQDSACLGCLTRDCRNHILSFRTYPIPFEFEDIWACSNVSNELGCTACAFADVN